MGNEKEYGKLSEDQFKRLIKALPEFRAEERELKALIKTTPKEKLNKILAGSASGRERTCSKSLHGNPSGADKMRLGQCAQPKGLMGPIISRASVPS